MDYTDKELQGYAAQAGGWLKALRGALQELAALQTPADPDELQPGAYTQRYHDGCRRIAKHDRLHVVAPDGRQYTLRTTKEGALEVTAGAMGGGLAVRQSSSNVLTIWEADHSYPPVFRLRGEGMVVTVPAWRCILARRGSQANRVEATAEDRDTALHAALAKWKAQHDDEPPKPEFTGARLQRVL